MSVEKQVGEEIGSLQSEAASPRMRPASQFIPADGSDPEVRLFALEDDMRKIRDTLILLAKEIDKLSG